VRTAFTPPIVFLRFAIHFPCEHWWGHRSHDCQLLTISTVAAGLSGVSPKLRWHVCEHIEPNYPLAPLDHPRARRDQAGLGGQQSTRTSNTTFDSDWS